MTLNWQERTAAPPKQYATFVAREIARKGHLVKKLKAKDSTGR